MIRVGICGCASIAKRYLMPAFASHPEFELVAVGSRDLEKARETSAPYGCRACTYHDLAASADVDLVYVPLPTGLHFEWVSAFLAAGKHVLCEKSLTCSYEESQRLVEQARGAGRLLMESFQFRFHRQHAYVRRLLDEGAVGQVRCFRSSFGCPPFKDSENIRYSGELGGGALLDMGAYTVKAATFLLGAGFEVRAASLWRPAGSDVDHGGGIFMTRADGVVVEAAFGFQNFYQCNYEIWGARGKITAHRAFTAPPGFEPSVVLETESGSQTGTGLADDHFRNMLSHVASVIRERRFEAEYAECLCQASLLQRASECAGAKGEMATYV